MGLVNLSGTFEILCSYEETSVSEGAEEDPGAAEACVLLLMKRVTNED